MHSMRIEELITNIHTKNFYVDAVSEKINKTGPKTSFWLRKKVEKNIAPYNYFSLVRCIFVLTLSYHSLNLAVATWSFTILKLELDYKIR